MIYNYVYNIYIVSKYLHNNSVNIQSYYNINDANKYISISSYNQDFNKKEGCGALSKDKLGQYC